MYKLNNKPFLKKQFNTLLVCSFIILFQSCSNKLEREKAKELLINDYGLPNTETIAFSLEKLGESGYEFYEYFEDGRVEWRVGDRIKDQNFLKLEQAGLITYSIEPYDVYGRMKLVDGIQGSPTNGKQIGWGGFATPKHTGKLTELGAKFQQNPGVFRACSFEFGEIKGILEQQANTAQVEYTIIRKNVTPFGEILKGYNSQEIPLSKSQTFIKYDDGWRVSK